MARENVTGATKKELAQLRTEFENNKRDVAGAPSFEETYCLAKIGKQPDDYDGPVRKCTQKNVMPYGSGWTCPKHGGATGINPNYHDEFTEAHHIEHGMYATRENLIDDFSEKDWALYNWVLREYPKAYDIDVTKDPASQYDLHRLAVAIVRAERGRGYVVSEGEVREQEVRNEEGRVVIDDDGEIVTEKSEHYLSEMLRKQDKKITKLEKELGITRKERRKHDQTDDAVEAIKNFAELGATFLERDEKDYNPDDTPWEDSNESTD